MHKKVALFALDHLKFYRFYAKIDKLLTLDRNKSDETK